MKKKRKPLKTVIGINTETGEELRWNNAKAASEYLGLEVHAILSGLYKPHWGWKLSYGPDYVPLTNRERKLRAKAKDPEAYRKYQRAREAKKHAKPHNRIKRSLRLRIREYLKKRKLMKNTSTSRLIGCSWEEARVHLESTFQPGMTWDNYGEWHIDHIIPLASAANDLDRIHQLNHYTNLQALWAVDNIRKSDKMPHELANLLPPPSPKDKG